MEVGVIFLSLGKTPKLREMQQNAIDSCIDSDLDINFKVLVCESGNENWNYDKAVTVRPPEGTPFNYNLYMNSCRTHPMFEGCEYIALCNSDLLFTKDWATNLIKAMKREGVLSACPMEPKIHAKVQFQEGVNEGRQITTGDRHVAGWCILQDVKLYETMPFLDTRCEFWHSDVLYSVQLKHYGLKHILVEDSKVHHLTSQTLYSEVISEDVRKHYTHGQDHHIIPLIKNGSLS